MADCGCGVMKAVGDPHGRSISSLRGIGKLKKAPKGAIRCRTEKRAGKKKWVCRDDQGRIVKKPKKAKRGRR